jgi:hypothetical protein
MGKRISIVSTLLAVVGALFALMLASVPAAAHQKDGHAQGGGNHASDEGSKGKDNDGDADNDPGTSYTEDNDTNDDGTPNNQPDEGDNKHPSGKDRSVENGNSGNQGKSESDPDGGSNGGPDKPNGSGGVDKADQDGNNGCGNDDDFEDDNNGNCGGKGKKPGSRVEPAPAAPCDADATMPGTQPCGHGPKPCDQDATMPGTQPCLGGEAPAGPCVDDAAMGDEDEVCDVDESVLPNLISRPDVPDTPEERAEVLGERLTQGDGPEAGVAARRNASFLGRQLPFTGASLLTFAAIAVGLLLAGAGLLTSRRRV